MSTAIYTGVTGLQAHQRRLDVVADNIANVNTTGYRGSRVLFRDLFAQTIEGGVAPSGTFGGTNPLQVGLGAAVGTIDVVHSQGSLVTTGVSSDLAVQGSGFFVLNDGTTDYFTRDGSFQLNSSGGLVDPATGLRVQGYIADADGVVDAAGEAVDIVIPIGGQAIVRETDAVSLVGNLSADAVAVPTATTVERTVRVYDSLGSPRDIVLTFTKQAAAGEWLWEASSLDADIGTVTGTGTIAFDTNGAMTSVTSSDVSITFAAGLPAAPVDPFEFTVSFDALTQLSGESDVTLLSQDGYERGTLDSFNVGRNGVINGVFTNGRMQVIGQVAVAGFANVGGLARSGSNLFEETASSGTARVGLAATGGRGEVVGGVLEQSNVDLGTEFSNMIVTQRGFQANARVITAADTLLQETVNLVR